ncbi:MAG: phosphatase PAP2 family protein [Patescibacteria group bacterium]|nr:phosphatase PAP2 family protein [Patescibacteria group bacterium]
MAINELTFRWFNDLAGTLSWLDALIVFLANYLGWVLLAILLAAIIWSWGRIFTLPMVAWVAVTSLLAWVAAQVIKYLYFSPRPFLVLENVNQLIQHGANDSFPSGHTTLFMALGVSLYLINKKLGNVYIVGAVVIGLARVVAGVHWPLDILAGFILAWLIVLLSRAIFRNVLTKPDLWRAF